MALVNNGPGNLPKDLGGHAIQVGRCIKSQDDAPLPSPQIVSSSPVSITIPDSATKMVIKPTGDELRIGDNTTLDGTVGNGYYLIGVNEVRIIPVADCATLAMVRNVTDSTVYFYFEQV